MSLVCFDTNFVIWGVKKECTTGQEQNIERASYIIEQCSREGKQIVIPTLVLGELLSGLNAEKHGAFVQSLERMFILAPYDSRAAVHYARMWQSRTRETGFPLTRSEIKADFMIAAIAVAQKCDCIYTNDGPLTKFAKSFIPVIPTSEIILPAKQDPLLNA